MRLRNPLDTIVLAVILAAPFALAQPDCVTEPVEPGAIEWVSSLGYDEADGTIDVVDVRGGKLVKFSPAGEILDILQAPETLPGRPVKLFDGPGQDLLRLQGSTAVSLGPAGRVESQLDLSLDAAARGQGAAVGSIYDAVRIGDRLIGYGSIRLGGTEATNPREFQLGFFSAPITGLPYGAQLLLKHDDNKYYLLGHQYLTATSNAAFFLAMGPQEVELIKIEDGKRLDRLKGAVPSEYSSIEAIQTATSDVKDARDLYREVEGLDIPIALFAAGDDLFMLARDGGNWFVHQMPTELGQTPGRAVAVESTAHHMNVAASSSEVFFLEKGIVEGWGEQQVLRWRICPLDVFRK